MPLTLRLPPNSGQICEGHATCSQIKSVHFPPVLRDIFPMKNNLQSFKVFILTESFIKVNRVKLTDFVSVKLILPEIQTVLKFKPTFFKVK